MMAISLPAQWRRPFTAAIASLLMAVALAACGGATTSSPTNVNAEQTPSDPAPPGNAPPPAEPASCRENACAFPGAEGFGTATPGGRGGKVLVVTTLASSGPGSFREALLTTGPRIIVFRVSGVIDLGSDIALQDNHSYVTVLGQSSPGGITFTGTLSQYKTDFHDAIFRFLRIRGGNNSDNLTFNGAHHFVIDHMDFSGTTDETFDVTFGHDFTVQWSTITNSVSGGDSQNYGALIAYRPTTNISLHHNFTAHHAGRCGAQFHWSEGGSVPAGGVALDIRNNVFYNCGFPQIYRAAYEPTEGTNWNLIGNYGKSGPNTPDGSMLFGVGGIVYLSDNVYPGQEILTPYFSGTLLGQPHAFPAITTTSAVEAYDQVLNWAGSWPRDAMNVRTVTEARQGTGTLGKTDDALTTSGPQPPADSDMDGIADGWEATHGLNPNDPSDSARLDASGYAYVEVYLNEIAAQIIGR